MDQDRRAQWLRGVLEVCVLAILAAKESYGYELSRSLESAGLGPVQGGTLYPVLMRLERSGLVSAQWRPGPAGPARKYYEISTTGRDALRLATADWRVFAGGVDAVLQEVTAQ
ncbi:MAG: PadR family transcriptional regulator [Trebonia sp.]